MCGFMGPVCTALSRRGILNAAMIFAVKREEEKIQAERELHNRVNIGPRRGREREREDRKEGDRALVRLQRRFIGPLNVPLIPRLVRA